MRRILGVFCILLLLSGCKQDIAEPMKIRQQLSEQSCAFTSEVTADYGEDIYDFTMECQMNESGDLCFKVVTPQSISGISGKVTEERGSITFDDKVLLFPVLCEGQVTPVGAPWHLMHTLRSGYIAGSGRDGELTHVILDDSFEAKAMRVETWLSKEGIPVQGEIIYDGRRILTVSVKDFHFV